MSKLSTEDKWRLINEIGNAFLRDGGDRDLWITLELVPANIADDGTIDSMDATEWLEAMTMD